MTPFPASRYALVSRRAALTGALGAALLALAACSNDDSTLSGTGSSTGSGTGSTSTGSTGTAAPSPSATASASSSSSASSGSGAALPASAALTVSFTFAAAASNGPARNPYIAVWIEDATGKLVKTVALWHEDRGGQDRWLSEMTAFSALGAADADTVSSATRQAGSYSVTWDGSTLAGGRAVAGTYRLFVEAAREHGPYELVQHDVTLGSKAASSTLTPSGELTAVSSKYAV